MSKGLVNVGVFCLVVVVGCVSRWDVDVGDVKFLVLSEVDPDGVCFCFLCVDIYGSV